MLVVNSIEKLCECVWHVSKNADVCQHSGSCGSSLVFHGTSMNNHVMNPEGFISGSYLVVLGIFLATAIFLGLVSQIFRGH